jgi:hypothetical protein
VHVAILHDHCQGLLGYGARQSSLTCSTDNRGYWWMLDPITSGGVLTNDGGNGGGSNYPSSMRRAPSEDPREGRPKNPPMSPPATAPTRPATIRPRACTGSGTDHIGAGGWRNCQDRPRRLRLEAARLRPKKGVDGKFARLRRWKRDPESTVRVSKANVASRVSPKP